MRSRNSRSCGTVFRCAVGFGFLVFSTGASTAVVTGLPQRCANENWPDAIFPNRREPSSSFLARSVFLRILRFLAASLSNSAEGGYREDYRVKLLEIPE